MQSAHGMFFNGFFLHLHLFETKGKKMLQTELTCSLHPFQKCYINKTHIYKYLFFINI